MDSWHGRLDVDWFNAGDYSKENVIRLLGFSLDQVGLNLLYDIQIRSDGLIPWVKVGL